MNAVQVCLFFLSAVSFGVATRIYIWVRSKVEADIRWATAEGFNAREAGRYANKRRDNQLVWTRHILKVVGALSFGIMFIFDHDVLKMVLMLFSVLAASVLVTSLITISRVVHLLRYVPRRVPNRADQIELNRLRAQAERCIRLWCLIGCISALLGGTLLLAACGKL